MVLSVLLVPCWGSQLHDKGMKTILSLIFSLHFDLSKLV